MPLPLAETIEWVTPVIAPAGGENLTAASVGNGLGGLSNPTGNGLAALTARTAYLKSVIDGGVKRVQSVADIPSLRNIHSFARLDGDLCSVLSTGSLFRYNASSNLANQTNTIVAPTDVGGGAGRWIDCGASIFLLGGVIQGGGSGGLRLDNTTGLSLTTAGSLSVGNGCSFFCAPGATFTVNCLSTFNDSVHMVNLLTIDNGLDLSGASTVRSPITFTGGATATFNGSATFNGAFNAGAGTFSGTLTANDSASISAGLNVTGGATIAGPSSFINGLTVGGAATFNGGLSTPSLATATFNGVTRMLGGVDRPIVMTPTASGTVAWRRVVGSTSNADYCIGADGSAGPGSIGADEVVTASGLSGAVTYTVHTSGAVNGNRMRFSTNDPTHLVNIVSSSTAFLMNLQFTSVSPSSTHQWCDISFNGTDWEVSARGWT